MRKYFVNFVLKNVSFSLRKKIRYRDNENKILFLQMLKSYKSTFIYVCYGIQTKGGEIKVLKTGILKDDSMYIEDEQNCHF